MKKLFTVLLIIGLCSVQKAQNENVIQTVINKVSVDSLMKTLTEITGGEPVILNNVPTSILSRNRISVGNSYMPYYISKKFDHLGLVSLQKVFLTDGLNVYAFQNGTTKPNQYVIVCAHYDNMPASNIAPGADDNGSGTAAVFEIARVLSKYKFEKTIIYALWDLEEYGLYGSLDYAQEASSRGDNISAVINLDMIAYDSNNDYKAEVHARNVSSTLELGQLVQDINKNYSVGINLLTSTPGSGSSDHASFWRYNYPAVLLIESFSDFNAYYHKITDDITKINKPFFEKMTKLAIGAVAASAVPSKESSIVENLPVQFKLFQNYPNPFNPSTAISYKVQATSHVTLRVFDILGREVATLVDEFKQPGVYNINFNVETRNGPTLQSGVYYYRLTTGSFSETKKMVFIQ